ncbi:hypothetical protein ACQ4PT_062473 [Festuca glaucescens]
MLKKCREAYQQSTKEDKEEILKKRREAYQQKKTKESEERDEKKEEMLKKQREAYQQNKTVRCAQKRQRYANMQPEQKKARIEKVAANKILKRNTPCKESIAMVNPAYIEAEQEGRTSTLNVREKKPVTPGERQKLLHRRNEEFSTKKRKTSSVSSQEDTSMMNSDTDGIEPLKQPEVMINGIYSPLCPPNKNTDAQPFSNEDEHDIPSSACPTNKDINGAAQSFCNDDDDKGTVINFIYILIEQKSKIYNQICCAGNDEVIFEHDTMEEEYMFYGQDWEKEVEIEIREDEDSRKPSHKPDPYDDVYRNIPKDTHMLKTQQNCRLCGAKKLQYETMGLCCKKGQIKFVNPETPPELMRLWTSNDSDARHFRDNIRFFDGHFSFTTLYCHLDRDTTDIRTAGIYTFRAHGQIYHNLHSFLNSRSDPSIWSYNSMTMIQA